MREIVYTVYQQTELLRCRCLRWKAHWKEPTRPTFSVLHRSFAALAFANMSSVHIISFYLGKDVSNVLSLMWCIKQRFWNWWIEKSQVCYLIKLIESFQECLQFTVKAVSNALEKLEFAPTEMKPLSSFRMFI